MLKETAQRQPWYKFIRGNDSFIRHHAVAELIADIGGGSVLDVGGEGTLSLFAGKRRVVTVNVRKAHVIGKGQALPFKQGAVDVAVALDTIEHLPKDERTDFIGELTRVARLGVIVCAPLGTAQHIAWEKQQYQEGNHNRSIGPFLLEHITCGLPAPEEVKEWMSAFNGRRLLYQGDYRTIGGRRGAAGNYLCFFRDVLANIWMGAVPRPAAMLRDEPSATTNRFFMVLSREKP